MDIEFHGPANDPRLVLKKEVKTMSHPLAHLLLGLSIGLVILILTTAPLPLRISNSFQTATLFALWAIFFRMRS